VSTLVQIVPAKSQLKGGLLTYAAAAMLLFSILPEILWNTFVGGNGAWIGAARLAALALMMGLALLVPRLRPLWKLAAILLAITVAGRVMDWAGASATWASLVGWIAPQPVQALFSVQLVKLGVSAIVLLALAALGFSRRGAYLTRGEVNALAGPEPWMGFPQSEPWLSFGTKWVVFLGLGMVVILSVMGRPSPAALLAAWRFVPVVLILAGLNAFNEELVYRSSMLAPLVGPLGVRPAHLLTAVLFGIGHYYGVPYGMGGVALAIVMGWFLGKAMLETKGFFWPWLLHVVADVCIFYFILAGSIIPGG
jgi:membrane protease YdiL (CAAX protease family)